MKTKMMKVMAVAVVAAMVFSAASAYAGEGWGGKKGEGDMKKHFDKMAEELKLTPEQKATLDKQREATKPKMEALREKMHTAREQLRAELDKATPDTTKLASLIEEMKNLTGEQIQMKIDRVLEMKKVLTPEQSAKMKTIMEEKKKEFEGKRGDKEGREQHHDEF